MVRGWGRGCQQVMPPQRVWRVLLLLLLHRGCPGPERDGRESSWFQVKWNVTTDVGQVENYVIGVVGMQSNTYGALRGYIIRGKLRTLCGDFGN